MTPFQTGYLIGQIVGTIITPLIFIVVIGTIYYLIKGRRIPYRQALLNRWVVTASLILFLLGLVGNLSSFLKQNSSHSYPEREVKAFVDGCVASARAKLSEQAAQGICTCSITEIQKVYTYGEFKRVAQEVEKNQAFPDKVRPILTSCIQKQVAP